jgi:hypothetical protein
MVSLEHAGGEGWIRLQRRGQPMHGAVQILSRGMFSSVATGVESARACCEHSALHTFKAPFWLLGGNGLGVEKLVRWLLKPSRRAVMVACNQSVGGRGEQLNPRLIFFFLDGGALLGGATGSRGRRELQTERHRGKEKNARAIH